MNYSGVKIVTKCRAYAEVLKCAKNLLFTNHTLLNSEMAKGLFIYFKYWHNFKYEPFNTLSHNLDFHNAEGF